MIGVAAVAVVVVPVLLFVIRVAGRQSDVHRLERLVQEALPPTARILDSGLKDDRREVGFAYGVSADKPGSLLAVAPAAPWGPGPPLPEAPDTRLYRSGDLVLSIKVTECFRLPDCRPGDSLVYAEVQDIS
ncbi:MAG: hypothetical protein JJD92_14260 [Frankiaceae bacterium]|nr:hypothetical protein [Frankiaceae bacterium]